MTESQVTPITGWTGTLLIPITGIQSLADKRVIMFRGDGARIPFLTTGSETSATIANGKLVLDMSRKGWFLQDSRNPYKVCILDKDGKLIKAFDGERYFQFSIAVDGVENDGGIEL